jgi:hypothetical protein
VGHTLKSSKTSPLPTVCHLLAPFVLGLTPSASGVENYAERIAPLIDPAKPASLRDGAANPRLQEFAAHLAEPKKLGVDASNAVIQAGAFVGMKGEGAKLTADAMLRNLTFAERLGCLDIAGLRDMRRGQSLAIRCGPYKGDELQVDHIIPRAVCPELDNVFANLELMPLRLNKGKKAKIGDRQLSVAKQLCTACPMMATMTLEDQRHLEAARGWLGLGDWQSANDELEGIAPALRADAELLLLRVDIYLKAGKPDMAQPVTATLVKACAADWRAHYAQAQAEAQLRNFKPAKAALERAFALKDVRQRALDDPLLDKLWRNLD